jgi:hypothetical protein
VEAADMTLILHPGPPEGGTKLTVNLCRHLKKEVMIIDIRKSKLPMALDLGFILSATEVLNVAGPRESKVPGIQEWATWWLKEVLHASGAGCLPSQLTKIASELSSKT